MKLFFTALFGLSLSACTTSAIHRDGYTVSKDDVPAENCTVPFKYRMDLSSNPANVLGTIEASEPGMGIQCQQDYVFSQFLRDACILKADVVNITEETFPNIWSTCYRATAQFLRFPKKVKLTSDSRYEASVVKANAERGHAITNALVGSAAAVGAGPGVSTQVLIENAPKTPKSQPSPR